jgi:hypothetical protein
VRQHHHHSIIIILLMFFTEFINKKVQAFFNSKHVIWYTTHGKSSIAERANRTLMEKLIRLFTHKSSNHYLKDLQNIVSSYNATKHSSTGFAPKDINSENQYLVFNRLYKDLFGVAKPTPKFKVGMEVRWSLVKSTFEKG